MIEQGELVLLPYPFSDLKKEKVRPAIVISNSAFNRKGDDLIMAPLTTILKDEPYSFIITQKDLRLGKLLKPSRIRIDKLFTIDKNLIMMEIGKVKENIIVKIKAELKKVI